MGQIKGRLFAFGCSFTNYSWPTWADILGREFDYFENWGLSAAGNFYIFNALNECLLKNKLSKDDTVIIMWSSVTREDRYLNNQWIVSGNMYLDGARKLNGSQYIKKYVDRRGYLIRDLSLIHSAKGLLESNNIKHYFLSMTPMGYDLGDLDSSDLKLNENSDVIDLYKEVLDSIAPSVFEVIFNRDWNSRPLYLSDDQRNLKKELEKNYLKFAGVDWPKITNYLKKNFDGVDQTIKQEISNFETTVKNSFRHNYHPVPVEHLEYLNKTLPEFDISTDTKEWVLKLNQMVLNGEDLTSVWQPHNIKRL